MMDRPRWEVEGRDWPNHEASRFVRAGGLAWHVQVAGSGPVLLMLHGTGAATHSWRDLLPRLAARFTVVAPDLPGHGFTRGVLNDGATLSGVARALVALLAALDMPAEAIVGHSAGAAIALHMSGQAMQPGMHVVGLSPALLPFPGLAAQLFPTMAKLLFVNPFVPHLAARMVRSPEDARRFLVRATGSTIDDTGAALYARLFGRAGHVHGALSMMASWDLDAFARGLPAVRGPVLLLHGARDAAIPLARVREAAALMPRAELHVLDGLGHLAHEEAPDPVAGWIETFLAEQQRGT